MKKANTISPPFFDAEKEDLTTKAIQYESKFDTVSMKIRRI